MQATIEVPRTSVVRYRVVTVILAMALAVAIAWATMAAGSTKTVVRVSQPAASPSSVVVPPAVSGELCRPYHGRC